MAFQKTLLLVASFAFVAFTGCGGYLAPDRHISRTVAETELVGIWNLTTQSLGYLKRDGYQPQEDAEHKIQLLGDGSVEFRSVHVSLEPSYLDATGVWKISDGNRLEIEIDAPGRRYNYGFGIGEEKGRLLLWKFYGDPDMWEFVEYTSANTE